MPTGDRPLSQRQQTERAAAARAKAMVSRGADPKDAAKTNRTTVVAIRRWYGRSWTGTGTRRRMIPDAESLEMLVWTVDGPLELTAVGSDERLRVFDHRRAVGHFWATGDRSQLDALQGQVVAGHELETDPGEIEYELLTSELDFAELNSGPW
jgi:hypothetical protein